MTLATTANADAEWATIALETFNYNVVPWAGRRFTGRVSAWSRPHPIDPVGQVQLPRPIFAAFQQRAPGERLTKATARELGYPGVPGDQELRRVRRELHDALGRSDWDRAHDLDSRLRELQDRVAAQRLYALPSGSPR